MNDKEQYERKYYKLPPHLIHEEDYLPETRAMIAIRKKRTIKKWSIIIASTMGVLLCVLLVIC